MSHDWGCSSAGRTLVQYLLSPEFNLHPCLNQGLRSTPAITALRGEGRRIRSPRPSTATEFKANLKSQKKGKKEESGSPTSIIKMTESGKDCGNNQKAPFSTVNSAA